MTIAGTGVTIVLVVSARDTLSEAPVEGVACVVVVTLRHIEAKQLLLLVIQPCVEIFKLCSQVLVHHMGVSDVLDIRVVVSCWDMKLLLVFIVSCRGR